uniref:Uncharacterized protein n=1 Tax=Arundo donax TaxID=35708 RepID=A0A0A8Z966_ARUDO
MSQKTHLAMPTRPAWLQPISTPRKVTPSG